jgi:CDP-diglyceride synthetase
MYQPYPSSGQPAGPLRPPAPAPVLTAVKLMYAGAAVSAVNLIISLAVIGGLKAYHGRFLGHSLTAAQVSHLNTVIIAAVVTGLVVIALWLWMARANGQGRNWARILSTVLFGLATLELTPYLFGFGEVFGVTVFGLIFPLLTWLVGLAVVWLLWRPASSAFFRPQGITQAGSGAAISSRIRSSRARPPRQW